MNPDNEPRILLVEDDPTSRAFLTAAAQGAPAHVDGTDSMAAALTLAATHRYDLWLFDAQLPDGTGHELLARLQASHPRVPALAHTASTERVALDGLIGAGFAEVLVKPLPAAAVQSAIRRALKLPVRESAGTGPTADIKHGKLPIWDDEAAARALNFNRSHIEILRGLFVDELPLARERIHLAAQAGDEESVRAELHKLRASCGFVGAARLGATVLALQHQPDNARLLARFDEVVQDNRSQHRDAPVAPAPAQPASPST